MSDLKENVRKFLIPASLHKTNRSLLKYRKQGRISYFKSLGRIRGLNNVYLSSLQRGKDVKNSKTQKKCNKMQYKCFCYLAASCMSICD